MPQMSPINWLILFSFFLFIYLLFNILNYYSFYMTIPSQLNMKKNNLLNKTWKW